MSWRNYFRLRKHPMIGYSVVCAILVVLMFYVRFCGRPSKNVAHVLVNDENATPIRITRADLAKDTLHINTATATQLRHAGFTYYMAMRLLMYTDAGGSFRNAEQLKGFDGIDTALVDKLLAQNMLLFDNYKSRPSYSRQYTNRKRTDYSARTYPKRTQEENQNERKRHRVPRYPFFKVSAAQMDSLDVDPQVRDSILEYQKRYVLSGTISEDTLVMAEPDDIWDIVKPHIKELRHSRSRKTKTSNTNQQELNTITFIELSKIKYVKDYAAMRILARRDSLGGFVSVEQLLEVRSIDEERLRRIAPQVKVDASLVKKIKVNMVSEKRLAQHPYIGKKMAYDIYRTRRKKPIEDYEDFAFRLVNYELPEYLEPYLDFSQKERK